MADAVSREERPRTVASKDLEHPDASLASGDVEAGTPHRSKDGVGVATPT